MDQGQIVRQREVIVLPEAEHDLVHLHEYVKAKAGRQVADHYLDRMAEFPSDLSLASERGTLRSEVRTGPRVIGFERRGTAAFFVDGDKVKVLRIFVGGQNWQDILGDK